ncbi:hypothetical protein JX265_007994 [Neoarthrinium moseri]|uniref:Uncharacterized protein n=1 Tax=Neoarthrinium moseri TaxID=1658444 RepID=A0A9P9WJ05_9PEZI|nr:uncharacterized protein JN550_004561 [Neoarthrinium moseri]KAI1849658.1 hypothetical protein JX266_004607 [Neoarthrinium moseri]KAI1865671.1 hypothetical protein JX265_007994 [Neoarthrinium moseri]KAI1871567.1 hypothetical protein JN550_004561 [Neoarthrinium moseri]
MIAKTSSIVFASVLMTRHLVSAQFDGSFTLWSEPGCGTDPKVAFKEHSSAPIMFVKGESSCSGGSIGLEGFTPAEGRFSTYIDGSFLGEDCKLVFYDSPPDGESKRYDCWTGTPYRVLKKNSGCINVPVSEKFIYAYCCGKKCDGFLPVQKREELASTTNRDITKIKRAAIFERGPGKCNFKKTGGDVEITYKRGQKTGQTVNCPTTKSECEVNGEYSSTVGVSRSTSDTNSISVGASGGNPFFQVTGSYGHEWTSTTENSNSDSWSQSYSLKIPGGSSGYLVFKAKILCSKGTFEGDGCDEALKGQDSDWCVPAFTTGSGGKPVPDGTWSVLML